MIFNLGKPALYKLLENYNKSREEGSLPQFKKAEVTQYYQHILVYRRAKIQPDRFISKVQYLLEQETKMTHRRNYSDSLI